MAAHSSAGEINRGLLVRPPMSARHCSSRGFTLVELMVASVIVATALVGVYSVFRHALEVEGRACVAWRDREAAHAVVDELASALERVVNPSDGSSIKGGLSTLTFFAAPGGNGGGASGLAFCWYEYGWNAPSEPNAMSHVNRQVVACAGNKPIAVEIASGPETDSIDWHRLPIDRIGDQLADFAVEYKPLDEQGSDWVDNWKGQAGRVAIRVRCQVGQETVERMVVPRTDAVSE